MTKQQGDQQIAAELYDWQVSTVYTVPLPAIFYSILQKAYPFTSAFSVRMTGEDYRKMRKTKPGEHCIRDINSMFFIIKTRTERELEMSEDDYLDMQDEVERYCVPFMQFISQKEHELKVALQEKLQKEYEEKQKAIPAAPTAQA